MPTRRLLAMAVLALCGHLALGFAHNYHLGANDDRLWLYHTGSQIGRSAESDALNARVEASLAVSDANANKIWRYEARERYRTNYVAATTAYRAAAEAVKARTGTMIATDYPGYLARAMYVGYAATFAAACICFVLIVVTVRDRRLLLAVCTAVAAIALLETVFDAFGDTWWGLPVLLPDAQTSETFWQVFGPNFPGMLLNPQVQMSPFGDTPRNHFILLALALFVVRWRGAYTASYALLFALSFLHQSQTGLLAAYVIAADAVLRPRLFRSGAGPLAALTMATYLARETLGDVIGAARPAVLAALVVSAGVVAAALWLGLRTRTASRAGTWLDGWRQRMLSRGDVAADLLVIAGFWIVSFPIAALINARGTELQSLYFWTQLHGRSLGILRPAFILGLTIFALDRAGRRWGEPRVTVAAVIFAAAALLPSAWLATTYDRAPVAKLEAALRDMDRVVGPSVDWATIGSLPEERIYYVLARTLDRGEPGP